MRWAFTFASEGDRSSGRPGLRPIVPVIDLLRRVSLRIVTMPIQSQASSRATT